MKVCHTCDTRACVNPEHLFVGTQRDNIDDAMKKGRLATKLTRGDAEAIREMAHTGIPRAEIASIFGVSYWTICDVVSKRTWL